MHVPVAVRFLSGAGFILLTAMLFVGGAQPEAAGLFQSHWDKVAHFALFALLAALLMLATGLRHPTLALVGVIIVGVSDELAQTQLPGRHADLPDLATDVAGALCAVLLMLAARRWLVARRARRP
jgi:VanZ family protein